MKLRLEEAYDVRFSGSPISARMHFKEHNAAQFLPFDYVEAKADGIYRFPLEGVGQVPGSKLSITGVFRAGHSFKFKDLMRNGPISFAIHGEEISIHTSAATIPLETERN